MSFEELPYFMTPKQLADVTGEHEGSITRGIREGRIPADKAVHVPLVDPSIYWTLALIWKSKGFLSHPARTWVQSFKDYFKDVKITIDD